VMHYDKAPKWLARLAKRVADHFSPHGDPPDDLVRPGTWATNHEFHDFNPAEGCWHVDIYPAPLEFNDGHFEELECDVDLVAICQRLDDAAMTLQADGSVFVEGLYRRHAVVFSIRAVTPDDHPDFLLQDLRELADFDEPAPDPTLLN